MTAQCTIVTGICSGCREEFPIKTRNSTEGICPTCNYPDARNNYDISRHEDKSYYSWAVCANCHREIIYNVPCWLHVDYAVEDLPEPIIKPSQEEEGISILWIGALTILALVVIVVKGFTA